MIHLTALTTILLLSTQAMAMADNFRPIKFVPLKAATFQMGSPRTELARDKNEALRTVTIKADFEIQETEVTQYQWYSVMGTNPSGDIYFCQSIEIDGTLLCANSPVNHITWNETQKFIKKLNAKNDGYTYRLPTEAEWEYAARAGSKMAFSFGEIQQDQSKEFNYSFTAKSVNKYAWYAENNRRSDSAPVASLNPNAFGLYDMHGNVAEWTASKELINGVPTPVVRGGAWDDFLHELRSARKEFKKADEHDYTLGFRLVRTRNLK
ncbi:MAG: formylglycine-generating enzyme family protein [Bacteriovoracaceae bacterium]